MSQKFQKAKYWTAVLYPESMIDDWQNKISDLLQIPYEYCIHDKDNLGNVIKTVKNKYNKPVTYDASEFAIDKHEHRKVHVHLVICFSNTTTKSHKSLHIARLSVIDICSKEPMSKLLPDTRSDEEY